MSWWCTATRVPWDWTPRAYPGNWVVMGAILAWYLLAWRHAPGRTDGDPDAGTTADESAGAGRAAGEVPAPPEDASVDRARAPGALVVPDRWRFRSFIAGWLVLWLATDWPLGALGAGYLASAHMLQFVLYTAVAAPLLIVGLPEWMVRRTLARTRSYRLVRAISRPLVAAVIYNVVLIATHAPLTVDTFRTSEVGSFVLDMLWLVGGLILWTPVVSALDEVRPGYAFRGVYLFLAAGVLPMIPGGFLTFADHPLYATYELAPRVTSQWDPTQDQQFAGFLMKVGSIPLIWPVIGVLFFRWYQISSAETSPTGATTRPARR